MANDITKMENTCPLKIHLTDDDLFCLKMYELHLTVLGYKDIKLHLDGNACLNHLGETPDVIFLDYGIDETDGCEILKKIKAFNPDIYVVFICSPENIEQAKYSLKYGAFDFILKGEHDLDEIKRILTTIKEIKQLLSGYQKKFIWK